MFASPAYADVDADIAALKDATEKYKDEKAAIADGFMKDDMCVSSPDGKGVMGYHYVNPKLMESGKQEITKPPILIYQDGEHGTRKLVAVEYFQADKDQDLETDDDKPTLFGKPFDGPMEGHSPGMPKHYDLHAWVWETNPSGMFAQYNPNGKCPPAHAEGEPMDHSSGGQVDEVPAGGAATGGGIAPAAGGVDTAWLLGLGAVAAGAALIGTGRVVAGRKH